MKLLNYTKPKMIVADEGKHIRLINDIYISEHTDEHYNCGDIKERNELINIYTDFGFHKDEVESWYEWLDE